MTDCEGYERNQFWPILRHAYYSHIYVDGVRKTSAMIAGCGPRIKPDASDYEVRMLTTHMRSSVRNRKTRCTQFLFDINRDVIVQHARYLHSITRATFVRHS
jgi:hypothetical protein